MKKVERGEIHGEGVINCTCDQCHDWEDYVFDNSYPDFKAAQQYLRSLGWLSLQVHCKWKDFCCEDCRNNYIKENM